MRVHPSNKGLELLKQIGSSLNSYIYMHKKPPIEEDLYLFRVLDTSLKISSELLVFKELMV